MLVLDHIGESRLEAVSTDGAVPLCREVFPDAPDVEPILARVRLLSPPYQRVLAVERANGQTTVTLERFIGLHGGEVVSRLREVDRLLPLDVWAGIARAWLGAAEAQRDGISAPKNVGFDLTGHVVLSADAFNLAVGRLRPVRDVGTRPEWPRTMSPEHARGVQPTEASRVYSIAASLLRLLTAEPLFSDRPLELLQQILTGRHAWSPARHPQVTKPLAAIITRAIALRPEDRFPTVRSFREALEPALPPSGDVVATIAGLCEPGVRAIVDALLTAPDVLPPAWRAGGLRVLEDRLLERAPPLDYFPRPTCAPAPTQPPSLPGQASPRWHT